MAKHTDRNIKGTQDFLLKVENIFFYYLTVQPDSKVIVANG